MTETLTRRVLAFGGEAKNTLCCAGGDTAWISEPFSDLKEAATFDAWLTVVQRLPGLCEIEPECLAYDLHPEYLSHKAARRADIWPGVARVGIQHHEAHIASCAAAEGIWHETVGLAFDGTGYGTDGTIWGGEYFRGSLEEGFSRFARLRPMVLAGGEAAIQEPWRLAVALLLAAGIEDIEAYRPATVDTGRWELVKRLCTTTAIPRIMSSSAGRLFDGIAALLGICTHAHKEAEAALALEHAAGTTAAHRRYGLPTVRDENGLDEIDWRGLIQEIDHDLRAGTSRETIAAAFHDSLAATSAELCRTRAQGLTTVVAGGGVFWNKRFSTVLQQETARVGLRLVLSTAVPRSDAGLSLGQAVLAGLGNVVRKGDS